MTEFLTSIEQLGYSTWVREGLTIWSFATLLFLHDIAMALLAGTSIIINLRLLGFAPRIPLQPLGRLYPMMWTGFWLGAFTGTSLLMADANTKMRNPDFYVKMVLIAISLVLMQMIRKRVFSNPDQPEPSVKGLALASLICWLGVITAGRLMAYLGPVAGLA